MSNGLSLNLKKTVTTITLLLFAFSMLALASITIPGAHAQVLSTTSAPPGATVTVSWPHGTYPDLQWKVFIYSDTVAQTTLGTGTSDANGNLTITFTVPNLPPGSYHLTFDDVTAGSESFGSFNILSSSSSPTSAASASPTPIMPELSSTSLVLFFAMIAVATCTVALKRRNREERFN